MKPGLNPYALCSTELGQPPAGPPLVAGNLVLVSTQGPGPSPQYAALHAISLTDGELCWQKSLEHALVSGVAVVQISEVSHRRQIETPEALVLISITSTDLLRGEGAVVALDMAGEERWRWAPGVQRVSAPTFIRGDGSNLPDGRATEVDTGNSVDGVCITADAQMLVILDPLSGSERTRLKLDKGASIAAPALADDFIIIPCRGPYLLAVRPDGHLQWRFEAEDTSTVWLDKTPLIVGKHLFAVLSIGKVLALSVDDGWLAWRADVGPPGRSLSQPATDGDRLFIGARDGLHALNVADGSQVWAFPTPRRFTSTPIVAGDVVYGTCHDHHLYALDLATGRELWRFRVERRIEVSPALATCGKLSKPCAFIADRGGTLTAVVRPLSASEHEAAGHWIGAASAYASLGRLTRGAELLETHGEPLRAAKLWKVAGKRVRAALQYEIAGAWQQAAETWADLGRTLKQAEALEAHARSLESTPCSDEVRSEAWTAPAQVFEAVGETQRAAICWREVARCLRQPIITLDVQLDKGLVLNAWSRLQFIVRNEGYGPARSMLIRASGEQFQGQVMTTRRITTLLAKRKRTEWLDARPLEYGDSVPLRVRVEYRDHAGEPRSCEQTVYIPVARTEDTRREGQTINVFVSGSGAVAAGEGAVAAGPGGVALGEGAVATFQSETPACPSLPATAHVLSFDKLSPADFERLCLWLVEREGYRNIEHLGLAGSEQGRDVIAYKLTPHGEELWYFQCKRYHSISAGTLKREVDKYLELAQEKPHLWPAGVVFVVSCAASAKVREEIGVYCEEHGLAHEFWALTELDMRVKRHPDLLREFFNLAP